jgi:hypothetical protein
MGGSTQLAPQRMAIGELKSVSEGVTVSRYLFSFVLMFIINSFVSAEVHWTIDFGVGEAVNAPQSYTIAQETYEDIRVNDGKLTSRGLERPPLYTARIGRVNSMGRGWELEFIHHKLFLDNPTQYDPRLHKFEITHGFNMFLLNRTLQSKRWPGIEYRLGVGTNYVHPDVRFDDDLDGSPDRNNYVSGNNVLLDDWRVGYHWGGYAVHASIAKVWQLKHWRFTVEPKFYHSGLTFPVNDGYVELTNSSASVYVSAGYQF